MASTTSEVIDKGIEVFQDTTKIKEGNKYLLNQLIIQILTSQNNDNLDRISKIGGKKSTKYTNEKRDRGYVFALEESIHENEIIIKEIEERQVEIIENEKREEEEENIHNCLHNYQDGICKTCGHVK